MHVRTRTAIGAETARRVSKFGRFPAPVQLRDDTRRKRVKPIPDSPAGNHGIVISTMPDENDTSFGQTTKSKPVSTARRERQTALDVRAESGGIAPAAADFHRTIGYARVSRAADQELDLQLDALRKAGVVDDLIFADKASGATADRPGLEKCLAELRPGEVLLVWRLDRLGRSMAHLVALIEQLRSRGVGFRSICDGAIDTTTASGELIFSIFAALAQFERSLIVERTKAGLAAALARGRYGGRRPIQPSDPRVLMAKTLHRDHTVSIDDICRSLRISRSTLYRYLRTTPVHVESATGMDHV